MFKQEIKLKLKTNVEQVLYSMDINEFTNNQKLKYLYPVLPYLVPKLILSYNNDVTADVPLFPDDQKNICIYKCRTETQIL